MENHLSRLYLDGRKHFLQMMAGLRKIMKIFPCKWELLLFSQQGKQNRFAHVLHTFWCRVSILFFICLLTRLCFIGRYLDSYDSVNFALGLHDYDLSLLQPHFPGYPAYMFLAWLFFKLFHHEIWALILPGVLFSSLTVYPLSFLARLLFSERVAILTAVFYLLNPLCWLQAERPTSDAMGLFFIMLSAHFLYRVFNSMFRNFNFKGWHGLRRDGSTRSLCTVLRPKTVEGPVERKTCLSAPDSKSSTRTPPLFLEKEASIFTSGNTSNNHGWFSDRNCLFLGSLAVGFGLGVRLSYFPFIALLIGILFYVVVQRTNLKIQVILYGLAGFAAGVCSWFFPQLGYIGWHPFLQNSLSFSYGHFTDWGGSIITFGGLKRIDCLIQSIWVYGLGGWWYDFSFLRLIPSLIMIGSLLYLLKRCRYDHRWWFFGVYIIPYTLWVILGQNAAHPRHILPIIPMILMLIAYGLCKAYDEGGRVLSLLLAFVFIISMSVISLKIVVRYHDTVPAPIQLIQFIERQFNTISTRVYCVEEKRFFDYYAPLWDARHVRDTTALNTDLQSSLHRPNNILLVHSSGEIRKFGSEDTPIGKFEGNPYTDNTKDGLLLYTLTGLQVGD